MSHTELKLWRPKPVHHIKSRQPWTPVSAGTGNTRLDPFLSPSPGENRSGFRPRPLVIMTDADGVHFRVGAWQIPFMRRIGMTIDQLMRRQTEARSQRPDANGHQVNTEVFFQVHDEARKPLTKRIVKALSLGFRRDNTFHLSTSTMRDALVIADIVSRFEQGGQWQSAAQVLNVVNSCGVVSVLEHVFEDTYVHALAGQEFVYDDEGIVTGVCGLAFDDTGNPVATPGRVFTNDGKAKFAQWLFKSLNLDPSQMVYLYDGETDHETVGEVIYSQQVYAPAFDEALTQGRATRAALPRFHRDGSPRQHPREVPAHYFQVAKISDWVEWGRRVDLDCLLEQNTLSAADLKHVPKDGAARRSVLFKITLEAAISRGMAERGLSREEFGPYDLGIGLDLPDSDYDLEEAEYYRQLHPNERRALGVLEGAALPT